MSKTVMSGKSHIDCALDALDFIAEQSAEPPVRRFALNIAKIIREAMAREREWLAANRERLKKTLTEDTTTPAQPAPQE